MKKIYGYARVSTREQNLDRQIKALLERGVDERDIVTDKASGKYNIITANIVAAAILSLAPHVPVLMAPGARFIASGIIDTRKDEVLAGLRAAGLEPVEIKEKRGWVCVICKNAAEV